MLIDQQSGQAARDVKLVACAGKWAAADAEAARRRWRSGVSGWQAEPSLTKLRACQA